MTKTPVKITTIDYYDQFQCLGGDCELTCCSTWKITIEDQARQRYEELGKAEGLGQIIASDTPEQPNSSYIKLNDEGCCPLLDSSGLCSAVCKHGEDTLGAVCKSFPRYGTYLQDRNEYHLTLTLGCPEVTRKAVFRTEPLAVKSVPVDSNLHLDTPDYRIFDLSEKPDALLEISSGVNKLVQQREVPIFRRLTTLMFLCSEMDRIDTLNNEEAANLVVPEINSLLEAQQSQIPDLAPCRTSQLDLFSCFLSIIRDVSVANIQMPFYTELSGFITRCLAGLKIDNLDAITDTQINAYAQAYETYIAPYLAQNPTLQENIFSSQMIKPMYLFTNTDAETATLKNFFNTCASYLIIIGLATGIAAEKGAITDEDMVKVIFLTHRLSEKNPQVEAIYYQLAQALGYTAPDKMHTMFT